MKDLSSPPPLLLIHKHRQKAPRGRHKKLKNRPDNFANDLYFARQYSGQYAETPIEYLSGENYAQKNDVPQDYGRENRALEIHPGNNFPRDIIKRKPGRPRRTEVVSRVSKYSDDKGAKNQAPFIRNNLPSDYYRRGIGFIQTDDAAYQRYDQLNATYLADQHRNRCTTIEPAVYSWNESIRNRQPSSGIEHASLLRRAADLRCTNDSWELRPAERCSEETSMADYVTELNLLKLKKDRRGIGPRRNIGEINRGDLSMISLRNNFRENSDRYTSADDELAYVCIEKAEVVGFWAGGEMRLCLAQIIQNVLLGFSLDSIHRAYKLLQVHCSLCDPRQLDHLKRHRILPSYALRCGLVRQSDAHRLCSILLRGFHPLRDSNCRKTKKSGKDCEEGRVGRGGVLSFSDRVAFVIESLIYGDEYVGSGTTTSKSADNISNSSTALEDGQSSASFSGHSSAELWPARVKSEDCDNRFTKERAKSQERAAKKSASIGIDPLKISARNIGKRSSLKRSLSGGAADFEEENFGLLKSKDGALKEPRHLAGRHKSEEQNSIVLEEGWRRLRDHALASKRIKVSESTGFDVDITDDVTYPLHLNENKCDNRKNNEDEVCPSSTFIKHDNLDDRRDNRRDNSRGVTNSRNVDKKYDGSIISGDPGDVADPASDGHPPSWLLTNRNDREGQVDRGKLVEGDYYTTDMRHYSEQPVNYFRDAVDLRAADKCGRQPADGSSDTKRSDTTYDEMRRRVASEDDARPNGRINYANETPPRKDRLNGDSETSLPHQIGLIDLSTRHRDRLADMSDETASRHQTGVPNKASPRRPQNDRSNLAAHLTDDGSLRRRNDQLDVSDEIPVKHHCYGGCEGVLIASALTNEDSPCIHCSACQRAISPINFVTHFHVIAEVRATCHWGFEAANWRNYITVHAKRVRQHFYGPSPPNNYLIDDGVKGEEICDDATRHVVAQNVNVCDAPSTDNDHVRLGNNADSAKYEDIPCRDLEKLIAPDSADADAKMRFDIDDSISDDVTNEAGTSNDAVHDVPDDAAKDAVRIADRVVNQRQRPNRDNPRLRARNGVILGEEFFGARAEADALVGLAKKRLLSLFSASKIPVSDTYRESRPAADVTQLSINRSEVSLDPILRGDMFAPSPYRATDRPPPLLKKFPTPNVNNEISTSDADSNATNKDAKLAPSDINKVPGDIETPVTSGDARSSTAHRDQPRIAEDRSNYDANLAAYDHEINSTPCDVEADVAAYDENKSTTYDAYDKRSDKNVEGSAASTDVNFEDARHRRKDVVGRFSNGDVTLPTSDDVIHPPNDDVTRGGEVDEAPRVLGERVADCNEQPPIVSKFVPRKRAYRTRTKRFVASSELFADYIDKKLKLEKTKFPKITDFPGRSGFPKMPQLAELRPVRPDFLNGDESYDRVRDGDTRGQVSKRFPENSVYELGDYIPNNKLNRSERATYIRGGDSEEYACLNLSSKNFRRADHGSESALYSTDKNTSKTIEIPRDLNGPIEFQRNLNRPIGDSADLNYPVRVEDRLFFPKRAHQNSSHPIKMREELEQPIALTRGNLGQLKRGDKNRDAEAAEKRAMNDLLFLHKVEYALFRAALNPDMNPICDNREKLLVHFTDAQKYHVALAQHLFHANHILKKKIANLEVKRLECDSTASAENAYNNSVAKRQIFPVAKQRFSPVSNQR